MESTPFCGAACHTVMEPEYTTYRRSPHARVKCVECHIGEGAGWFVKSKLSGSWQLVSVAFNLYPRPIPRPRPQPAPRARDLRAVPLAATSSWATASRSTRTSPRTRPTPREDRAPGEGRRPAGGPQPGHPLARRPRPRRCATARTRSARRSTRSRWWRRTARRRAARSPAAADTPEGEGAPSGGRWTASTATTGRPTSTATPEHEIDDALLDRRIDPALPFVRREGLKALQAEYPSHEAARAGIAKAIADFYRQSYPQVAADKKRRGRPRRARRSATSGAGTCSPAMNIKWGTYRNHLGHRT